MQNRCVEKCLPRNRKLKGAISELGELLEREKPFIFSWRWIRKRNLSLARYFDRNKVVNKTPTHNDVIKFLPKKWQRIFDDTIFSELVTELFCLLEKHNPERFSKLWIIRNKEGLYVRIISSVRQDEQPDWHKVISALPVKWQKRWCGTRIDFWKLIKDLTVLLEKENPQHWNKVWVIDKDKPLYKRIFRNVRKHEKPDWDKIVSALPKKWQEKWVGERCHGMKLEVKWKVTKGSYFSEEEVETALVKYKTYLYTMLVSKTKEEKMFRNEILNSLIRLSQNGNVCARERLISFLELKYSEWFEYEELSAYKMARSDVLSAVNTCINNYCFEFSFLGYLHKFLGKRMNSLCIPFLLELDSDSKDGGRSYHETIDTYDYDMEDEL